MKASDMSFHTLNEAAIGQLFEDARSHNGWRETPVPVATLRELYRIATLGPTAFNCQPMRVVFVTSHEGKQRLVPALKPNNVAKTLAAPVTAIVACDTRFFEQLPRLSHNPAAKDLFTGNASLASTTAMRNGSLQGAYLMIAARALGLDCGPMSGYDAAVLDAEFFPDGQWKSNFLCSLGQGDPSKLFTRLPRLSFDEACQLC